MPNAKMISVNDFNGGVNDLLPPDQINPNEALELYNFVPGEKGQPLPVRPGTVRFNQDPFDAGADYPVRGLWRYRMKGGTKHWVATSGKRAYTSFSSTGSTRLQWDKKDWLYSKLDYVMPCDSPNYFQWGIGDLGTTFSLDEDGHLIVYRYPMPGATSAQLRWDIKSPYTKHATHFLTTGPSDPLDIAYIKVGDLKNGIGIPGRGEFRLEIRGDSKARIAFADGSKIAYSPGWVTCVKGVQHTLEWLYEKRKLTVWLDGVKFNELDPYSFGLDVIPPTCVLWRYAGVTNEDPVNGGCALHVYDMSDTDLHWSTTGALGNQYKSSVTPGARATIECTTQLDDERMEVVCRKATNVRVLVNGAYLTDTDGNDVVLSNDTNVAKVIGDHALGVPGTKTIALEISYDGGALSLDAINIRPPSSPFNAIVSDRTEDFGDTDFCVLNDKLLFTDGNMTGLYVWDGTGAAVHQTNSVAHHASPGVDETTSMPTLKYLQTFRGRAWGAGDPQYPSRVHFTAPLDPENWYGTAQDDGGNLDIDPDNGEIVTGIGRLFNGVVVFKERSIYLWTYGDADNPGLAGRVEQLVPGTGLVSHATIAYYNGAMLFLGQNAEGDYGMYQLMGAGVQEYSVKIPEALHRILVKSTRMPKAIAHNHHYMVSVIDATDTESTEDARRLTFVLDLRRQCWTTIGPMPIGAWAVDRDYGNLYYGSDVTGYIYQYGVGSTDDGQPIHYKYLSKPHDGKTPLADHRFRNLWADFNGASSGDTTIGYSLDGGAMVKNVISMRIPDILYWDDGQLWPNEPIDVATCPLWFDGEMERHVSIPIPTNRAKHLSVLVEGDTSSELALARYGIAVRERKTRY